MSTNKQHHHHKQLDNIYIYSLRSFISIISIIIQNRKWKGEEGLWEGGRQNTKLLHREPKSFKKVWFFASLPPYFI